MLVLRISDQTRDFYFTDKNKGTRATTSIKRAKQFKTEIDIYNYFNKIADEVKLPSRYDESVRDEIRNWRKWYTVIELQS